MTKPPLHPLRLTIFFPCHNEEANVENTTLAALDACARFADDYEIIIVDDGSRDRTGPLADGLAATHEHVRAIHNPTNLGYGGALQVGFTKATKDWVFYTDGDGQFDFGDLSKVLPLLERCDIVSAYRLNRCDSIIRKFNAWAWTTLVNAVFGMRVRDIDCAFKVFPRTLFDRIEMRSGGALIDAEILAEANYLGYTIGQVGVRHYARSGGEQSGASVKVIARAFVELFRLRKQIKQTKSDARARDSS